jgi:putative zinc finger/helix-turn-helix YgiT family protein
MIENMLCLKCKNERFAEKFVDVPQTFRGDEFAVNAPSMVCMECGWATMTDAQADKLCVLTADEFRRRHGLLTSAEIVACRKARGMSQRKFAAFIGVGEASVKRWETGNVQERIYDDRIRQKCADARRLTHWAKLRAKAGSIYIKAFHVTTTADVVAARGVALTHSAGSCTSSGNITFMQLSDGHPWRAAHLAANDPTFSTSA